MKIGSTIINDVKNGSTQINKVMLGSSLVWERFPTSGLTSYWRLDEGSGTVVHDSVGGNNGTTAATWVDGKNGSALSFNNNSVDLNPISWTPSNPSTVSAWYKKHSNTSSFAIILSNLDSTSSTSIDCYLNQTSNDVIQALLYKNTTGRVLANYTAIFPNDTDWHHIVFTYNGDSNANNMRCYIDGTSYSPSTVTNTMTYTGVLSTGNLCIQKRRTITYANSGTVDEVGIWNRALSSDEISILYNSGSGRFY